MNKYLVVCYARVVPNPESHDPGSNDSAYTMADVYFVDMLLL